MNVTRNLPLSLKRTQSRARTKIHLAALLLSCTVIPLRRAAATNAYWNPNQTGRWAQSANWSTPTYPNNDGTNLFSATVDAVTHVVTLDCPVTIEVFSLAHGTLTASNAPVLTVNQQFQWGGNKLDGAGTLLANSLSITGATKTLSGWLLENHGAGEWLGGDIHLGNGGILRNATGAVFQVGCDSQLVNDLGGTAQFENAGTFRKTAGLPPAQTKIYVPFQNSGTVQVDVGELAFYGNCTNTGGQVVVSNGATLQLTGPHQVFDANSMLGGAGTVKFDNGTVDLAGEVNLSGPVVVGLGTVNVLPSATVKQCGEDLTFGQSGALNLNSGETASWHSLTMSNGTLDGSDDCAIGVGGFYWAGGMLKGSGRLDLNDNSGFAGGAKTLRGRRMNNHGSVQWLSGDVYTGDGAQFVNLFGATVTTDFDGNWANTSGTSRFDNFGAIEKTGGTNATSFTIPFYNEGLVIANSGALRFNAALTNAGGLSMAAGASLVFASASAQLSALGSVDGDGEVILNSGVLTDYGSFRAGGLTLKSGLLRFTNTTSRPNFGAKIEFDGNATLDLSSGHALSVPVLIHTNGTLTGSDSLVVSNAWICNGGDLTGSGRLELRGASIITGGPSWSGREVVNYGDLDWASGNISAGVGLMLRNAPGGHIYVDCSATLSGSYGTATMCVNQGAISKSSSGITSVQPPFVSQNGYVYCNAGVFQFNGGYAQTNGLLALNGGAVASSKLITINAGWIAGSGDVLGSLYNDGTMAPGWANGFGQIRVSGNCTQAVTATLLIELGGTNDFDTLVVTNVASLAGTLAINAAPDFAPREGDSFRIVQCGARSGTFAQVTGASLPGHLRLVPTYDATGMSLTVVNALTPPLSIERLAGTNAVKVSWPDDGLQWTLQGASQLAPTNWTSLLQTSTNFVVLPADQPVQFFRLSRPADQPL